MIICLPSPAEIYSMVMLAMISLSVMAQTAFMAGLEMTSLCLSRAIITPMVAAVMIVFVAALAMMSLSAVLAMIFFTAAAARMSLCLAATRCGEILP